MAEEKQEKTLEKMTGAEKAAVLMMSLGDEAASEIMRKLGPKEVQAVGEAIATLQDISRDMVTGVVNEFAESLGTLTSLGTSNEDYLRNVLKKALGEDKAENLIDRILLGRSSKGLEALKWMESRAIADFLRLEHPQIISIVLSYLEPEQSSEILQLMPQNMRTDLILRIASLDGIQPSALNELDEILEKQFSGESSNYRSSTVGGHKTAANILNFMDSAIENEIMESLKDVDEQLGAKIEDLMFVFDNLKEVDDRGIQTLLREVNSENLVIALKGADDVLREKIMKNMSKRAAEMLRDDLEAQGPVKVSEVDEAQKEILAVARRMAEAGEISLGGADEYI